MRTARFNGHLYRGGVQMGVPLVCVSMGEGVWGGDVCLGCVPRGVCVQGDVQIGVAKGSVPRGWVQKSVSTEYPGCVCPGDVCLWVLGVHGGVCVSRGCIRPRGRHPWTQWPSPCKQNDRQV